MTYNVIIADPPWDFGDRLAGMKAKTHRAAAAHYATMPTDAIAAIPVREWAADDAILALWTPCSMLADGLAVMDAWGFRQTQVVTWVKRNASGKLAFGMGRQFRGCKEIALVGVRGSPKPAVRNERDVFEAAPRGHSAKPDCLHAALARMYPDARRLELFARTVVPGWTCVGLECEGTDGIKAAGFVRAVMEGEL